MPYYGYYGIDMYYIVLVLPCVLFAFWAQNKVNSTFNRYSRVQNLRGLTGAQAAEVSCGTTAFLVCGLSTFPAS